MEETENKIFTIRNLSD